MWDYREFLGDILISEEALAGRVRELGEEISHDYAGKNLLLVCILRGGVMFLTDLMRAITIPHAIEFMAVSSYGVGGRESLHGKIRDILVVRVDGNAGDFNAKRLRWRGSRWRTLRQGHHADIPGHLCVHRGYPVSLVQVVWIDDVPPQLVGRKAEDQRLLPRLQVRHDRVACPRTKEAVYPQGGGGQDHVGQRRTAPGAQ